MPGRVMMESQSTAGQQSGSSGPDSIPMPVQSGKDGTLANGAVKHEAGANGIHQTKFGINGDVNGGQTELVTRGPPPQLDQSWRTSEQNKSMARMLERLAQHTFWELDGALTQMADLPKPPETAAANGGPTEDSFPESLERKRILLAFAKEHRDRYTKALVLSDWSRNEEDMARLIDIKAWQDQERLAHLSARDAIGFIKHDTTSARMPNPNIDAAMELMATGHATWIPDLGYVPQKRLTAKQLLKMLRNMNIILATRLNLHDDVPPQMKNFTIADGRATFTVAGEFAVDLAVADDHETSNFYFIDFRFLFTPATESLTEQFRGTLETRVNAILGTDGLKGCYNFLHNLVLTHKINTLRAQAQALAQDKWFDCIAVTTLRRSLIVRYWSERPGPKSWLEFGIVSGSIGTASSRKATPSIAVKWYQRGVLTPTDGLDFDFTDLNMEKCLRGIISRQINDTLLEHRNRLVALASKPGSTKVAIHQDNGRILSIDAPALRSPMTVRIDIITGRYSISPPSQSTLSTERRINHDGKADVASWLATMLCSVAQEQLARRAELLQWTPVSNMARQDVAQIFGSDVRQRSVYARKGWDSSIALVVTFSLHGPRWWVVKLEERHDARTDGPAHFIKTRRELRSSDDPKANFFSREHLLQMEGRAVAEVSLGTLSEELRTSRVPHHIEDLSLTRPSQRLEQTEMPSLSTFIRFGPLMRASQPKTWDPWATDMLRLTHRGIDDEETSPEDHTSVRHDIRLSLKDGKMKQLRKYLTKQRNQDIAVNESGGLALKVRTPLGQPVLAALRQRILSIECLDRYISVLQKLGFRCTCLSLARLSFAYGPNGQLSAQITNTGNDYSTARLKISPATNPHLRIRRLLEQALNTAAPQAVEKIAMLIWATLPLMQCLDKLDLANVDRSRLRIRVRSLSCYALEYLSPFKFLTIHVILKKKQVYGKVTTSWLIEDATNKDVYSTFPDNFKTAMAGLWRQNSKDWNGIRTGIIAGVDGVAEAVEKVHEVISSFDTEKTLADASKKHSTSKAAHKASEPSNVITLH